jgi:putative oxidoreductase
MSNPVKTISGIAAWVAAIIMLQTLYFKFTASPESVYIFTRLGLEPYGRIGVGIAEALASLMLVIPQTRIYGAILGLGVMAGALLSHFTKLGIVVMDDGAYLFILCLIVLAACMICLWIERIKIKLLITHVFTSRQAHN